MSEAQYNYICSILTRIAVALEKQNEFQERKAKAIEGIEAKGKNESPDGL